MIRREKMLSGLHEYTEQPQFTFESEGNQLGWHLTWCSFQRWHWYSTGLNLATYSRGFTDIYGNWLIHDEEDFYGLDNTLGR